MRRAAAAAALLALALLAPARAEPIEVAAAPVPLHADPEVDRAGALVWRAGYALTSPSDAFGGLSDLVLTDNGRRLLAVGDKGHWLRARLDRGPDGRIAGLSEARLAPYRGPDGAPQGAPHDGESLTLDAGTPLVGFEQVHRIFAYPDGLDGPARPVPAPADLPYAGANKGAETLLRLADGRLLVIAEGRLDVDDADYTGWLRSQGRWQPLAVARRPGYHPTGAAQLPGGDVLLLTRAYDPFRGVRVRLRRIPLMEVRPGGRLDGTPVARLRDPYTVDNFEGVAVTRGPEGETRVLLLSDDNFNSFQRTLLLEFALSSKR